MSRLLGLPWPCLCSWSVVVTKLVRLGVQVVGCTWWSPDHGLDQDIEERRKIVLVVEWEESSDGYFHFAVETRGKGRKRSGLR